MIRLAVRVCARAGRARAGRAAGARARGRGGGRRARRTTVEYAVYGAPGELPEPPDLHAIAGGALVEISTSEVADDWHERWRQFHRPVLIEAPPALAGSRRMAGGCRSRRCTCDRRGRSRARQPGRSCDPRVVIDPGQAFGTGGHASTRLCLELLLELAASRAVDGAAARRRHRLGCARDRRRASSGSSRCSASTTSPRASQAARENAAVNGVEIDVRRFDLRARPLPWTERLGRLVGQPVVLANLLRPLLLELAGTMPSAPAHLIAGGLLGPRSTRSPRRSPSAWACASASGGTAASGRPLADCQLMRSRPERSRISGAAISPRRYLGGGADVRAVDEVDRRAHAVLVLEQRLGGARARRRSSPAPRRRSPGSGSRQAAIAMSSIARACSADAREQRRADEARVAVDARQAARQRDRGAAPRRRHGRQPAAVEQRRHRAAEHRLRRGLVEAGLAGHAQRHVERRRGQAVGRVGGEHDPLGGHAREQLDHVEREEAGDVVEHARVVGQARGQDALVADRAVREDQHRARVAQREVDQALGERRQAAAGVDQDRHARCLRPARRRRPSPAPSKSKSCARGWSLMPRAPAARQRSPSRQRLFGGVQAAERDEPAVAFRGPREHAVVGQAVGGLALGVVQREHARAARLRARRAGASSCSSVSERPSSSRPRWVWASITSASAGRSR